MKVINYETKLQVVFAILDDDGDVIRKVPFVFELPKLNEAIWSEAFKAVMAAKAEVAKQISESKPAE